MPPTSSARVGLRRFGLAVPALALALAFSACGGDDDSAPVAAESAPATETAPSTEAAPADETQQGGDGAGQKAQAAKGITVATGDSQFGEVLFDGDQRAIYYFDKEKTSESECYGDCAVAWPPVLTDGRPVSDGGAQKQLLGTTERRDGSTQVTYDGRPLYYYVDDPPGVVLCHNVAEFGALWLAVQPDGAAVP